MFAKQYSHRLPANYDMDLIRRRAAELGPLWDDARGLLFKAFIARERGVFGASANQYASVYLWSDPAAAAAFLMDERFQKVIDSFGRPQIEAWLPLDFQLGTALEARALYREELAVDPEADRARLLASEIERNQALLRQEDTFAVFLALDTASWRLVRITLSSGHPDRSRASEAYEVLYLAQPGVESRRHGRA
ncbi:DUF4865 domain-containing protein [Pseudomonas gingeri NCPPB 3146 = LMG 5327]|uniref:DUF4865 family protein n=2 Tax=Pseudomonas gingeri TaxID=117681 RepID=A0A7Y8CFG7_9PSED|nr:MULTISPECIES: DUF4865 family protein [Pseudomonas]NVZ62585.1 DUF4865 family protein [Pseudomonas gingeri]NVZ77544.1 DUF4865 family protein [Pseudomonas gingeri]NWA09750.1 DUF4865 family protein [Pseudomonas gingeri]NWC16121.1 DUF4865 family protein [Pseudomonas gingeri]NWE73021.1 DUF4865 family protein [Pseudomonas gingeri]